MYLISLSRLDSVIPIVKFVSGTGIPNVLNVPGSSNRLNSASKPVKNSVLLAMAITPQITVFVSNALIQIADTASTCPQSVEAAIILSIYSQQPQVLSFA